MADDPTSPVEADVGNRAVVDAETRSGDFVRAPMVVLAIAEDGDVARPAGTPERPVFVAVGSNEAARQVVHLDGVSVQGSDFILAADPMRTALTVRNASDTQMRMRVDGDEAGPTDYPLDAGRGYEFPPNMIPFGAVSIYCGTAGKAWNVMLATGDPDA